MGSRQAMPVCETERRLTQKTSARKRTGISPGLFNMPVDPVTCRIHMLAPPQGRFTSTVQAYEHGVNWSLYIGASMILIQRRIDVHRVDFGS